MPLTPKSKRLVNAAFREVMENEPSTVARANVSGERKQAMRTAIALDKARKRGARIRRRPRGSGTFSEQEMQQGYRGLG